jgi:hypothetical protein
MGLARLADDSHFRENLLANMNDRQIETVAQRYGYPDF